MSVLRSVAGMQNSKDTETRWTDAQVRVTLDAPPIEAVMRRSRVRHLCNVLVNAPPVIIRLVFVLCNVKQSWPNLVLKDLSDIRVSTPCLFESMPDPFVQTAVWFDCISGDPKKWSRDLAKYALESFWLCRRREDDLTSLKPLAYVQCPMCEAVFETIQQLRTHCCNVHGMYNPILSRITNTVCASCGTQFHSYKRITKHLVQRSDRNRCHKFYLEQVPPVVCDDFSKVLSNRIESEKLFDKKLVPPPPVKLQ